MNELQSELLQEGYMGLYGGVLKGCTNVKAKC